VITIFVLLNYGISWLESFLYHGINYNFLFMFIQTLEHESLVETLANFFNLIWAFFYDNRFKIRFLIKLAVNFRANWSSKIFAFFHLFQSIHIHKLAIIIIFITFFTIYVIGFFWIFGLLLFFNCLAFFFEPNLHEWYHVFWSFQ